MDNRLNPSVAWHVVHSIAPVDPAELAAIADRFLNLRNGTVIRGYTIDGRIYVDAEHVRRGPLDPPDVTTYRYDTPERNVVTGGIEQDVEVITFTDVGFLNGMTGKFSLYETDDDVCVVAGDA